MSKTTEKWLPVKGYESIYEVSNLGNVRRCAGSAKSPSTRPRKLVPRGKYYQVLLSREGKVELHWAHRLVAFAFLGHPPDGADRVNHKDGDGRNNAVSNLEWTDHQGNCKHAYDIGLRKASPPLGEDNGFSKLTEESVRLIRSLHGSIPVTDIASKFNVTRSAVHRVISGKTWRHVRNA